MCMFDPVSVRENPKAPSFNPEIRTVQRKKKDLKGV